MNKLPKLRLFDPEKDYNTVHEWWLGHGWNAVPVQVLPKLGVIGYFEDSHDAGAGWLYMDNSIGVCWLEWLVTNPENRAVESLRIINTITEYLKSQARDLGYTVMMTTCRQASLVKVHERNGFIKTDEGMTHLVQLLN